MKPRTLRNASSKASHGPLAPLRRIRRAEVAARDPQRRPPGLRRQAARRQDGVEQGQAERSEDRRRPQVRLDPFEDGPQADQLARGVEVEQLVGQVLRPGDVREAGAQHGAHRLGPTSAVALRRVVGVEWRLALVGPAALVAADRAAVVACDRPRRPRRGLVFHDQMNSSATSIRPQVAQRVAKRSPIDTLRLDSRRGEAAIPWNAASRWRTSGGRSTTSASILASGLDSSETARRQRSTAARATQPPRPNRSATTSPGPVWRSIRAATIDGGGAGARRSKTGSE
jgi:hypothetical protein